MCINLRLKFFFTSLSCVVCNGCQYNKLVICFKITKCSVDEEVILMVNSYDGNYYICNTCDNALRKNKMPCRVVANTLSIEVLPKIFQGINRLERLLISRRILLKRITVMPKAKLLKMKGSMCNISVTEVDEYRYMLPRPADSNGLLLGKLKRKLKYKDYVEFEAVRSAFVLQFLEFLKSHNQILRSI